MIQLAKNAGAKKIYFSSAAPAVKYTNMYGINIPTTNELIAYNKNNIEVAKNIGADMIFYNELDDVIDSCIDENKETPKEFETSCFNGEYIIT